jgi:hypothetical protein
LYRGIDSAVPRSKTTLDMPPRHRWLHVGSGF